MGNASTYGHCVLNEFLVFEMGIRVYDDEEEWFQSIFSNSNKEDAIQNQYEFFVQRMGGPPLYSQRKGLPFYLKFRFFSLSYVF